MPIRMTETVRDAYATERSMAAEAIDPVDRWRHLERAHVLSQPSVVKHVSSHVAMLRQAISERDRTEIVSQPVRIALAGPASGLGRIPVGNTGRAHVPLNATPARAGRPRFAPRETWTGRQAERGANMISPTPTRQTAAPT